MHQLHFDKTIKWHVADRAGEDTGYIMSLQLLYCKIS